MTMSLDEKKTHVRNYVKSLKAIEDCIAPYKEQRKELDAHYKEQKMLTSDELKKIKKAISIAKADIELEELGDIFPEIQEIIQE